MNNQHKLFQIFKAGTHTSMGGVTHTYTESDLALMAACYSPRLKQAPLVLGHPTNDQPTFGEVDGLFAKDGALYAQSAVSAQLVDLVRSRKYTTVSASFFPPSHPNNPAPGAYYLKHVGFLGAHPPAVKGMSPPAFSESSGCVAFSEGCNLPRKFSTDGGFPAPHGYQIEPDRAALHSIATDYQRACAGLSYMEAVQLAETVIYLNS